MIPQVDCSHCGHPEGEHKPEGCAHAERVWKQIGSLHREAVQRCKCPLNAREAHYNFHNRPGAPPEVDVQPPPPTPAWEPPQVSSVPEPQPKIKGVKAMLSRLKSVFKRLPMALLFMFLWCATAVLLSPTWRAEADTFIGQFLRDSGNRLAVNCEAGCSGAGTAGAFTGGATGVANAANQGIALFGYNGTTNDYIGETSNQLWINCKTGCSSGGAPFTGGASGVATAANQGVALFGYNGSTQDALQESGGALNDNQTKIAGNAIATAASGTQMVGVEGHAGAAVDAVQGASAPANNVNVAGTYNSSLPSLTTGQSSAIQLDSSGRIVLSPTNAVASAQNSSGPVTPTISDGTVDLSYSAVTATVKIISNVASAKTWLWFYIRAGGSDTVTLSYGTGTNCGTGNHVIGGGFNLLTGESFAPPIYYLVPASQDVCIATSTTSVVDGWIDYAQHS